MQRGFDMPEDKPTRRESIYHLCELKLQKCFMNFRELRFLFVRLFVCFLFVCFFLSLTDILASATRIESIYHM